MLFASNSIKNSVSAKDIMLLEYQWRDLLIELTHLLRAHCRIPGLRKIVFFISYPSWHIDLFQRTELFNRCSKECCPLRMTSRVLQWCFYQFVAILMIRSSPVIEEITEGDPGILPSCQLIKALGDRIAVPLVYLHRLVHSLKQKRVNSLLLLLHMGVTCRLSFPLSFYHRIGAKRNWTEHFSKENHATCLPKMSPSFDGENYHVLGRALEEHTKSLIVPK